jgi:hypothetical protein
VLAFGPRFDKVCHLPVNRGNTVLPVAATVQGVHRLGTSIDACDQSPSAIDVELASEGMGIGEHPRGRRIGYARMTDDQRGECLLAQTLKMGALRRRVGFFRDTEDSVLECRQAPTIRVISNVAAAFAEATQKLSGRNRSTTAQSEQFAHDCARTIDAFLCSCSKISFPPAEHAVFH